MVDLRCLISDVRHPMPFPHQRVKLNFLITCCALHLRCIWFPLSGIKREVRCKSGAIPVAVSSWMVNDQWSMVNYK